MGDSGMFYTPRRAPFAPPQHPPGPLSGIPRTLRVANGPLKSPGRHTPNASGEPCTQTGWGRRCHSFSPFREGFMVYGRGRSTSLLVDYTGG